MSDASNRSASIHGLGPLRRSLVLALLASSFVEPRSGHAQLAPFKNLDACRHGAFSTEEDFRMTRGEAFDGNPFVSDGDLLSPDGQVCARNAELLGRFDVKPDLGLDGVDVLDFERKLVAFSTELDSPHGGFTAGDVLFTSGAVLPNSALVAPFGIRHDVGLDELKFVGKIEDILRFVQWVERTRRDDWPENKLQGTLRQFGIDLWFSIEGTAWELQRPILDGDVLSAAAGTVVATNRDLLTPGAPAGLPADGVDFGLDAFAVAREALGRAEELSAIYFSTEIAYLEGTGFTDGDVLRQGGGVVATNSSLVAAFNPAAKFLGLDALWFPFRGTGGPQITEMCDESVGEFDGGIALVGGAGTGLHESPLPPPALTGTLRRPCGEWVPVHGWLPPPGTLERFRVAYREQGEPVPPTAGAPTTPAIRTRWRLRTLGLEFVPFLGPLLVCRERGAILETDPQGWMNAQAYHDALTGSGPYFRCPHAELRLAVWNTAALPAGTPAGDPLPGVRDREDLYAIWLEWEAAGGGFHRESVDHLVQLDNTQPQIAPYPYGLQLRLADGTSVPACGEAPAGASRFQVWGQFADRYYSHFSLGILGGDPPESVSYGPHHFYDPDDGTPGLKNTDDTGTVPDATTVHLRDVSLLDLGASATKCCYLLDLNVFDRAIRHGFDERLVRNYTGPNGDRAFLTFSAAP